MENKKEVILERTFDASPDMVWQAWTDPEKLKQWWGPDNVIIPECELDLRVGGRFYIVMEAGEGMGPYKGMRWPMEAKFTVIEPSAKLSYDAKAWTEGHNDNGESMIDQTTEVTFTQDGGKTKVHVRAVIHNVDTAPRMAVQGMQGGFTQQLEKLNVFLGGEEIVGLKFLFMLSWPKTADGIGGFLIGQQDRNTVEPLVFQES